MVYLDANIRSDSPDHHEYEELVQNIGTSKLITVLWKLIKNLLRLLCNNCVLLQPVSQISEFDEFIFKMKQVTKMQ